MLAVRILEALSETKIDDENIIFVSIVSTYQEVVGLDISMNNTLLVNFLNTLNLFKHLYMSDFGYYHLNSDAEDGFEVELPPALLEKIFETLSKQVHDHHVVGLVVLSLFVTNEVKIWYAR